MQLIDNVYSSSSIIAVENTIPVGLAATSLCVSVLPYQDRKKTVDIYPWPYLALGVAVACKFDVVLYVTYDRGYERMTPCAGKMACMPEI